MEIQEIYEKLHARVGQVFQPPPIDDLQIVWRINVTYNLIEGYVWGHKASWHITEAPASLEEAVKQVTKEFAKQTYVLHHAAVTPEQFVRIELNEPVYRSYIEYNEETDRDMMKYRWEVEGLLTVKVPGIATQYVYKQPIWTVMRRKNEQNYEARIKDENMQRLRDTIRYNEMIWNYLESCELDYVMNHVE